MPRIKTVEPNAVQCFIWQPAPFVIAQNLIQVLVVPPAHRDLSQTTAFFVNPVFRTIPFILQINIFVETVFPVNNAFRWKATDWKGVSNTTPLRLVVRGRKKA